MGKASKSLDSALDDMEALGRRQMCGICANPAIAEAVEAAVRSRLARGRMPVWAHMARIFKDPESFGVDVPQLRRDASSYRDHCLNHRPELAAELRRGQAQH